VTDDLRVTLMLMSNAVTRSTPESALRADANLGLALTGPAVPLPRPDEQVTRLMNVPALFAEFMLEALAVDQPPALRGVSPKHFAEATIIRVRLPEPIPMSFRSMDGQKIQIGFFTRPEETASAVETRVSSVLNALSHRQLFVAEFVDVDTQNFTAAALSELAAELRLPILRRTRAVNVDAQLQTCVVKIMKVDALWDAAVEARAREALEAALDAGRVAVCKFCGLQFCPADRGICEEPYHAGRQLQFPDGAWEEEGIEDGERVTYVRFSCCGKVLPYLTGCRTRTRQAHEPEETVSRLQFDACPLYPPDPKYE
jgi:hypothetical protein